MRKIKTIVSMFLITILIATLAPQSLMETIGVNTEAEASTILNNPKIVADSSMSAGQKVTWDCVWFGSYPQTEIVDQASSSGCYGKEWSTSSDYEVNTELYTALQNATYDSDGDTIIANTKYRRINGNDAIYVSNGVSGCYNWTNGDTYHYFRYDPIKWRVLDISDGKALLLADFALDSQQYLARNSTTTWEFSTIRSWMNGYGSSANSLGTDYSSKNFIDSAFTSNEQSAITLTAVLNEDNIDYNTESGYVSEGGNDTNDKIFLLSESEVYNTTTANSYGFVTNLSTYDEARRCRSSSFAKAMGAWTNTTTTYLGNCEWWLRSLGQCNNLAVSVYSYGYVGNAGRLMNYNRNGFRPALYLNLSSNFYTYAGTVCSDGTVNEDAEPSHSHLWITDKIIKQPSCTETGIITYTCYCGDTKTGEVPVSHQNTEIRGDKTASCKDEGYTGDTYCKDCGLILSTGQAIPKLNTHIWDTGVITKQSTVSEEGVRTYTCTVCGETKTITIPKIEDTSTIEDTSKAETHIHTYGGWFITRPPGVFMSGLMANICTVCGQTELAGIPNLTPTITLSQTKVTLKRNSKKKRSVVIKVNVAYTDYVASWKSSNKKVAMVNSQGKIVAKKKGKANITVTLASGLKAVVKVTVK